MLLNITPSSAYRHIYDDDYDKYDYHDYDDYDDYYDNNDNSDYKEQFFNVETNEFEPIWW